MRGGCGFFGDHRPWSPERSLIVFPELVQKLDGSLNTDLRSPSGMALQFAVVSQVQELVTRTRTFHHIFQAMSDLPRNSLD